ncbi:MAG: DUF3536 domain-containing protein [Pyrinomonadaceae bacterium]|nr:DUF3536 domain-containing protein [Pyrinomonadaceae bacterium]
MTTALVIHGHFYQPPRENPWTGIVDREPSAHPFHDWNERIHFECYRPNGYARIVDNLGRVERIVNNYTQISFNFGPTLLSWLEQHHPETYRRILEADQESVQKHGGHGNAIAQGYNHTILPLCNARDRRTQVRWGIADFRHRFRREPESLWLPETACNDETLETLIEENLRYVILSPFQAERVRLIGKDKWQSVADGSIDTTIPYLYFHRDGSGRSIVIFFYDGSIAKAIAFEGALASSQALVDRIARATPGDAGVGRIVNVATDGESYGHHFHFGDRCLAYALEAEAPSRGLWVTNYGEFLKRYPPTHEVEIMKGPDDAGTAWSCAHGVGRWSHDCGCQGGALDGWNQAWREPLRRALDFLRDEAARCFEATRGDLFRDPWAARDAYIELVVDRHPSHEEFFRRHTPRPLQASEKIRALTFLEMQRSAMLMYTSCGWFFADISGIETVQVIKYAGRVLDFMEELHLDPPRERFLELLAEAKSNIPKQGNGADIFRRSVEDSRITPERVASHLAICSLVDGGAETGEIAGLIYRRKDFKKQQNDQVTLATGRLQLEVIATGKQFDFAFAAMHSGSINFYHILKPFPGEERFKASADKLWINFPAAPLLTMLRLAQAEFGPDEYGLERVLPEERQQISEMVFGDIVKHFAEDYAVLYDDNRRSLEMLHKAGFELPSELRTAAEFTLGRRLEDEVRKQHQSHDPIKFHQAMRIAHEAAQGGYEIDRAAVRSIFTEMITAGVCAAVATPSFKNLQAALSSIKLGKKLNVEANLDQAQEAVHQALQDGLPVPKEMRELALMLGLSPRLLSHADAPHEMYSTHLEASLP